MSLILNLNGRRPLKPTTMSPVVFPSWLYVLILSSLFKETDFLNLPGEIVSLYRNGEFLDLCRGPHVASTGCVKAVKLLSIAVCYYRGDEHNQQLQRIYGTAFNKKEELEAIKGDYNITLVDRGNSSEVRRGYL